MYELELKNLLQMCVTANSVASCESYISKLETLKQSILRIGNEMGLEAINQINKIDKMLGKLDRKADNLDAEGEFRKRDKIKEEAARKDDKFRVESVEDETQARKGYKTG